MGWASKVSASNFLIVIICCCFRFRSCCFFKFPPSFVVVVVVLRERGWGSRGEQMKCQPHRQKVPRTSLLGFSTKCSRGEFIKNFFLEIGWYSTYSKSWALLITGCWLKGWVTYEHLSCIWSYIHCYELSISSKRIGDHCYTRPFSYMIMDIIND